MSDELSRDLERIGEWDDAALARLIASDVHDGELREIADGLRRANYDDAVFVRGLIEFTNFCRNDCLYCGIRCGIRSVVRYRLTQDEILACCAEGYGLGLKTFVLQGGEDPFFNDERLCGIVSAIHGAFPDCAITLSVGERSRESYRALREAGARRYLLRHETADAGHYGQLHPAHMSLADRKQCLFDLKALGYQVGSGFMVGSPFQTAEHLVADLRFLQELNPDMIGIGPFLRHRATPLARFPNGSLPLTLRMLSILRILFPYALLPSTTALGTLDPSGREAGLRAGANVVMPNLSPVRVRRHYAIYENKVSSGDESAQCLDSLAEHVRRAGYRIVMDVGDVRAH